MNTTNTTTVNMTMLGADMIPINTLFPVLFQMSNLQVIVFYKYIIPILVSIVVVCNTCSAGIFLKNKLRNSTHMLLLSICVCDMLSSLMMGIISVYVFYYEDYYDYLPYRICEVYTFMYNFLPVFFHYTSNYIIVGLAGHRYICVVYPFVAKRICSKKNTMIFILFSFLCSGIYLAFQIYSHSYYIIETRSFYNANVTVSACSIVISNFTLWYIHPILFTFIPFVILICLEPAILRTLQRSRSLKTASSSSTRNSSRSLSVITLWVVLAFMVCEFPLVVYMCATFSCLEFRMCSLLFTPSWYVYTHYTLFITSCSPIFNFIIYITFNRYFRKTFLDIFIGCKSGSTKRLTLESFLRETHVELLRSRSSRSTSTT
ncbi:sex peptide receptor-like [Ylistrum balloti]|uniref:sex peptide receptor-like n=1 Tax=Ylistrum balloti TaxID=509963 RepID=UPI0029058227|nr:sex peptide receptor-like [Ylistrum balloti]